jgi:aminoglycoside phosphotransferase (APT) family kinase protein
MATLDTSIASWVEDVLGGTLTGCERTPGGGSRHSYFVTVTRLDGTEVEAVLREESGGSFTGTPVSVQREAVAYRSLASTSVPVPAVLGVAPDGVAVLIERLHGSTDLGTGSQADDTLRDFVRVIGELHQLDVDQLDLPGFDRPSRPEDHAVLDLEMWRSLGLTVADLDPLIRYVGSYLIAHPPATVPRTSLVQGDTGPGNFLARSGRVCGLIDMEFAHIGDPMDDLAWLAMRAETVGVDPAPYLEEYIRTSGIPTVAENLAFYGVAVQYRCAVTTSMAVARGGGARGWAPYLLVTQRYLRGAAAKLCSVVGVSDPAVDLPPSVDTARTGWYDALLTGIRAGVKAIPDPEAREETRNQQILVHYLRAYDRVGRELEALDRADCLASVGLAANDVVSLGRVADEGGRAGDRSVLAYLLRRRRRQGALWASLLDRPA